ncbi:hypothetical protein EMA8858_00266 [Emticicia aquatica]|uniref:Universal stress protein n=1 Tax=Emticicia aquatica TaxID=1681835 RepID=A0ABN8ERN4_9BACT|nr:universal stress protein [Emticicia aquatica]CAH0994159.1 hypothetical protein EMA8858_00266 [Emticicia aquatica]
MTTAINDESRKDGVHKPRKILICIDLGKYSENILAYSFLVTQAIYCEYDVLYCLGKNESEESIAGRVEDLHEIIKNKYANLSNEQIKFIFSKELPIDAIRQLNQDNAYNCIMVGASNQEKSWQLGSTSQEILLNISSSILMVPPTVELVMPSNVSILIESQEQSETEKLTAFYRYASNLNIFINFILFAANPDELISNKKTIEQFQSFFDSNFTFSYIVQAPKTFFNFFQFLIETYCNAAVVIWNEQSSFYQAFLEEKPLQFPCNPNIPIFFSKLSEPIENADKSLIPLL